MKNYPDEEWRKDPSKWFLGMFYYNAEDDRLLPPKRIPWMGWTVNFANPRSVLLLIGILAVVAIIGILAGKI